MKYSLERTKTVQR